MMMLADITIDEMLKILGWVTAFTVAVIGAAMKKKWEEDALKKAKVTVHPPFPEVTVKPAVELVTKDEFESHLARIEKAFDDIKEALDGERSIARTANGNLHKRIDTLSEGLGNRLANLEGTVKAVGDTTDKLLNLALARAEQLKTSRRTPL